jgi:hypothetical protein
MMRSSRWPRIWKDSVFFYLNMIAKSILWMIVITKLKKRTMLVYIYNILGVCLSGRPPWGKGVRVSMPFINAFPWLPF